jgi:serine/threonine protein kinase
LRICPECNTKTDAERCAKDGRLTVEADRLTVRSRDPNIGMILEGKYEVISRIGRGGMGSVYKAVHRETGGSVAIKVMRADMVEDESAIRRFYIEAQNTHSLHHPNTVRVADFGQSDEGILFLVMEYVQGRSLQRVLKEEGRLSPARAVHIISQVLKSLGEAHERGIIHRDIKPDNVMLIDQFGEPDFVKVLDFGISRALEGTGASTQGAIGTPKYMAPEQWRGEAADARADLYACGGMLYFMLTGHQAFRVEGKGSEQVVGYMTAHLTDAPRPLNVELPTELKTLVQELLAKSRSRRPQGAAATLEKLRWVQKHCELSEEPAAASAGHDGAASVNEMLTHTPDRIDGPKEAQHDGTIQVTNASATGFPDLEVPPTPAARRRPASASVALAFTLTALVVGGGLAWFMSSEPEPHAAQPSSGRDVALSPADHATEHQGVRAAHSVPVASDAAERTVTLTSFPEGATVSAPGGEPLGKTPMTLPRAAARDAATGEHLDGDQRVLEVSKPGFVTQRVTLNAEDGDADGAQLLVTLALLPVLRITASQPNVSVRLVGTDAMLGTTPFDWTVSSPVVVDIESGAGATVEFIGEGEVVSVALSPDHLKGTLALHGELGPKGTGAKARPRTKRGKAAPRSKRAGGAGKGASGWKW